MKNFVIGNKGNTVVGVVLAIIVYILLGATIGLGGAIGGALAGLVGFGLAAVIKSSLTKGEETSKDEAGKEE